MPNSRFDLAEIARSALNDMPEDKRAAFMAEMLTEFRGPRAIEHLSKVRAVVSLRMQEMIDGKFPLHEMAAVYGDPDAVRARISAAQPMRVGFFDLAGARRHASILRNRRLVERGANGSDQEVNGLPDRPVATEQCGHSLGFCKTDGVLSNALDKGVCTDDVGGQHDLK